MSKKFLKVEISKRVYSTVFLAIDENDPRYQSVVKDGKVSLAPMSALQEIAEEGADKTVYNDEWESVSGERIEVEGVKVVDEKEAVAFRTWDVVTNDVFRPEQPLGTH